MEIKLGAPLVRGYAASTRDVRGVKRALGCAGYYISDPKIGVTDEAEPGFWIALRAFQRTHMVPFDDIPGPGSVTERIMNRELAELEDGDGGYIWRTVSDEKVRGEHAARAGRRFRWDNPPDGEHPGEDYNCRCWAEPLSPSRHLLAEEARKEQARLHEVGMTTGGMGMPVPEEILPPEFQEVSAASVLWGGARITLAACWSNKECRAWMVREGAKIILENTHHVPPKTLPAFPDAKEERPKGAGNKRRKRWIDSKGRIYEWDYQHGEVEVYDKTGKKHLGSYDPKTGQKIKEGKPGRRTEK